jgi:hypothetical protein
LARHRRIAAVIVWKFDRWARNGADPEEHAEWHDQRELVEPGHRYAGGSSVV